MTIKEEKAIISAYMNKPVHNIFHFTTDREGYSWYYVKDNDRIQYIVKFDPYLNGVSEVLR